MEFVSDVSIFKLYQVLSTFRSPGASHRMYLYLLCPPNAEVAFWRRRSAAWSSSVVVTPLVSPCGVEVALSCSVLVELVVELVVDSVIFFFFLLLPWFREVTASTTDTKVGAETSSPVAAARKEATSMLATRASVSM